MAKPEIAVSLVSDDPRAFHLKTLVREGSEQTAHEVTLAKELLARLAPSESPEAFVRRCFAFLLEREPKESILRRFDVSVIARYFPEFEQTITQR